MCRTMQIIILISYRTVAQNHGNSTKTKVTQFIYKINTTVLVCSGQNDCPQYDLRSCKMHNLDTKYDIWHCAEWHKTSRNVWNVLQNDKVFHIMWGPILRMC